MISQNHSRLSLVLHSTLAGLLATTIPGCLTTRSHMEPLAAPASELGPVPATPLIPEPQAPYEDSPQSPSQPLPLTIPKAARAPLPEEKPDNANSVAEVNVPAEQPISSVPVAESLAPSDGLEEIVPKSSSASSLAESDSPVINTKPEALDGVAQEEGTAKESATETESVVAKPGLSATEPEDAAKPIEVAQPEPKEQQPEIKDKTPTAGETPLVRDNTAEKSVSELPKLDASPTPEVDSATKSAEPMTAPEPRSVEESSDDQIPGPTDSAVEQKSVPFRPQLPEPKTILPTPDSSNAAKPEAVPLDAESSGPAVEVDPLENRLPEIRSKSVPEVLTPVIPGDLPVIEQRRASPPREFPEPQPATRIAARSSDSTVAEIIPVPPRHLRPVLFTELPAFADAIAFDEAGHAYVTHRAGISRITPSGEPTLWSKHSSTRGIGILPDGTVAVCDLNLRAVLRLNAVGESQSRLATRSDGNFLRAPGFLAMDGDGGIYFTDPGFARIRNPIGKIHYVSSRGTVSIVAQNLLYPEGLALSEDGTHLFVLEGQSRRILSFEVLSPGQVGPKRVVAELPEAPESSISDDPVGIAVDSKQRLFIGRSAAGRVDVLSPAGDLLTSVSLPGMQISNLMLKSGSTTQLFVVGGIGSEHGRGRVFVIDISGL